MLYHHYACSPVANNWFSSCLSASVVPHFMIMFLGLQLVLWVVIFVCIEIVYSKFSNLSHFFQVMRAQNRVPQKLESQVQPHHCPLPLDNLMMMIMQWYQMMKFRAPGSLPLLAVALLPATLKWSQRLGLQQILSQHQSSLHNHPLILKWVLLGHLDYKGFVEGNVHVCEFRGMSQYRRDGSYGSWKDACIDHFKEKSNK